MGLEIRVREQLHAAGATTGQLTLQWQLRIERGKDVLAFQVGVVGQQLVDVGAGGELTQYRADGDAGVANAGQAAHPVWINGDSLLGHGARVRRCPPLPRLRCQCKAEIGRNRR